MKTHHPARCRPVILALLVLTVFFLCPLPVAASVTHFIRADSRGVLYEYKYEQLLESYVLDILGQPADLYKDYAGKRSIAFKDDKNGYVDYHNVVEAYAISIITDTPFDMNQYTSSEYALAFEMPPSVISVLIDGITLTSSENILLTLATDHDPPVISLNGVISDKTEPQQILTNIQYTAVTEDNEDIRYAWYIYKDDQLFSSRWYTSDKYFDFVPTQAGNYKIRAWAVDAAGAYREATSEGIEISSPITIIKPDLKWRSTLTVMTEPVVHLVQHHMGHLTWDVYDVHNYHRTRTYIQDDGTLDYWSGIGYNYWIGFDGTIYEGRGRMQGAHAGVVWNKRTLGIGYQGHFDSQNMTHEQLSSGAWLNAILIVEDNLSVNEIIGHGNVSSTACPGKYFLMNDLKVETNKLLPPQYREDLVQVSH